jgi:hypothetical protein
VANSRALAQPFPPKPLRIVVPFPPSGSVELREEDRPDGPAPTSLMIGDSIIEAAIASRPARIPKWVADAPDSLVGQHVVLTQRKTGFVLESTERDRDVGRPARSENRSRPFMASPGRLETFSGLSGSKGECDEREFCSSLCGAHRACRIRRTSICWDLAAVPDAEVLIDPDGTVRLSGVASMEWPAVLTAHPGK